MIRVNPASFRDPNGFVFVQNGVLYRQVQQSYREHYDHFLSTGLYDALIQSELLVRHEEVNVPPPLEDGFYKILQPERIPFISYPYEWCFSQFKDAALTTLEIQKEALSKGMLLKDASAFNIQFLHGKPILIDTLSFERYQEGKPWIAYRQFCQHFLAPLALMSLKDIRMNQLLRTYIDGVPLDLAALLLPYRSRFTPSLFTHIHLHAKSQKRYARKTIEKDRYKISAFQLRALIDSLETAVRKLTWHPEGTEWGDYYEDTNYSQTALQQKKEVVSRYLNHSPSQMVWDLGANTGLFSRLASDQEISTIAFDVDPAAVEKNYLQIKSKKERHLLPLLLDLTNPSPPIGFENKERLSLEERGPADTILALALIHHLAISNNVPLSRIAEYFARLCHFLIIEFVPKSDSQVQRMLSTREDIFVNYNKESFEREFGQYFAVEEWTDITESHRTLYLMRKR